MVGPPAGMKRRARRVFRRISGRSWLGGEPIQRAQRGHTVSNERTSVGGKLRLDGGGGRGRTAKIVQVGRVVHTIRDVEPIAVRRQCSINGAVTGRNQMQ